MRIIPLTRGYFTYVDDADYEWLSQHNWCVSNGYAVRAEQKNNKNRTIFMHREILNAPAHLIGEHQDNNPLNNTRSNLRLATARQDKGNVKKYLREGKASSVYKGVYRAPGRRTWTASITRNYRVFGLGSYEREEDAALAYDQAAREYFGEFASLNFPEETNASPTPRPAPKRLEDWQVRALRRAREECELTLEQLAKAFGLYDSSAAGKVVNHETYKDVH